MIRLPFIRFSPDKKPQYSRSIVAARLIVKAVGANWLGVSELCGGETLALFTDGAGGDMLSLPMSELSMAAIRGKLEEARSAESQLRRSNREYYARFRGDPDFLWEHPGVQVV